MTIMVSEIIDSGVNDADCGYDDDSGYDGKCDMTMVMMVLMIIVTTMRKTKTPMMNKIMIQ